ncbi:MAG: flavodoxin family protein [Proteobacteria bacterium]|nr:flavodoxin family protein [Pseudomonadota bacterium]MBU1647981.1 flavodoxin family protein [Pseudomonadota bacterium]MBU1986201.1 flavodoxin family protein [Pseudomonadota bacterium]
MHTLIILGSPRKNGNSETLARSVASGIEQNSDATLEFIRLNDLQISPCQGCGGCDKTSTCVINDDMTALYEKVDNCDHLILVSPIYFYALSAQCKTFIDRFQARWARKYLSGIRFRHDEKRQGTLLVTAATEGKKIFDGALLTARTLFDALDLENGESLLVRGVDQRGAMQKKTEILAQALALGRKIASGKS